MGKTPCNNCLNLWDLAMGFSDRWKVVPVWAKVVPLVALLACIAVVHANMRVSHPDLVPLVRHAYYLPLFMASVLFGFKGGIACAIFIALNFGEDLVGPSTLTTEAKIYLALTVCVYFLVGGITGFLIDRERREAARMEKMRELASLGQAAAAVAHEMKTPLIAIGGFAMRIYRDLEPENPHREKLRIIVDQVAHMEHLLREVLEYSRPVKLETRRHALREIVREVLDLASLLAEESDVRLVADLAQTPVEVPVDRRLLTQVLLNLVQNAVQASPQGSVVRVSTGRDGQDGLIVVSDQGCGINEDDAKHVFDPFFTTKRKGTGLGLAIVQKIVQAHGGRIHLSSRPGQGSTFTVRVPLASGNAAAQV